MDQNITSIKKPSHNIYSLSRSVYKIVIALAITFWLLSFFGNSDS